MSITSDLFVEKYVELESAVRQRMTELFSESCGICTACCCRADICEEAGESAFLARLLEMQGLRADDMDERYGWLDLHGCSLEYGRPPVCYAYFCDELLADMQDDDLRFAARVLGKLINHIGIKARGGLHLVEIMDPADLENLNFDRLSRRLDQAVAAFHAIERYLDTGRFSAADREIVSKISTAEP